MSINYAVMYLNAKFCSKKQYDKFLINLIIYSDPSTENASFVWHIYWYMDLMSQCFHVKINNFLLTRVKCIGMVKAAIYQSSCLESLSTT